MCLGQLMKKPNNPKPLQNQNLHLKQNLKKCLKKRRKYNPYMKKKRKLRRAKMDEARAKKKSQWQRRLHPAWRGIRKWIWVRFAVPALKGASLSQMWSSIYKHRKNQIECLNRLHPWQKNRTKYPQSLHPERVRKSESECRADGARSRSDYSKQRIPRRC